MRLLLASALGLCLLSLNLIWLIQPTDTAIFERVVPQDILGLVVIASLPTSLDFLDQIRLRRWFDVDPRGLLERLPNEMRGQLVSLFAHEVKSVWLFIHHLARQENGSWRIHFTALLIPHPLQRRALERSIEMVVTNIFEEEHLKTLEYENVRIYKGREPGQILYQVQMRDFLLISNSPEGWQKTLRVAAGQEKSLAEHASFRRIKNHLRIDDGLFLYFRANRLFPLLPEFGYLIRWKGGRLSESYYEVKTADR